MKSPEPLASIWTGDQGAVGGAGTFSKGPLALHPYVGGILIGSLELSSAVVGGFVITQSPTVNPSPGVGLKYAVAIDSTVTSGVIYPFMVTIFHPYVTFNFTNGATPQTFAIVDIRARAQGL